MRSREDGQLRKSAATNSSLAVNKAVKRILISKDTEGTGRRLGDASVREELDDTLSVHQTATPQETAQPFHVIVTDHTDLGDKPQTRSVAADSRTRDVPKVSGICVSCFGRRQAQLS